MRCQKIFRMIARNLTACQQHLRNQCQLFNCLAGQRAKSLGFELEAHFRCIVTS